MPRGVKGTGKSAAPRKSDPVQKTQPADKKPRKAYPSVAERIDMADKQIKRMSKIIDSRTSLIEKTEATLNTRKAALAKITSQLEKARSRKERLIARKDKPVKTPGPKLSAEELKAKRAESLAKARAAKKAEKAKYDQLLAVLKDSGKSVDDLLKEAKE